MKKRIFILGAVGVVVLGAALAFAASQGHLKNCESHGFRGMLSHWGGTHHAQQKVDHIANVLELDESQKSKLMSVKESLVDAKRVFSQVRLQTTEDILALLSSDSITQEELGQIVSRHQSMVNDVSPKVTMAIVEFHATLSSEQKAKAANFVKAWQERLEHWQERQT